MKNRNHELTGSTDVEHSKRLGEMGYSLLELIIAMVIFLMVTSVIWGLLQIGQRSRTTTNQQVLLNRNVRISLNLLGRDTLNAGYGYPAKNTVLLPDNKLSALLGTLPDARVGNDEATPIVSGDNLNVNNLTAVNTDQVTFLFKDDTFNPVVRTAAAGQTTPAAPGSVGAIVSQALISDKVRINTNGDEIEFASDISALCRTNDIFLITGPSSTALGVATNINGKKIKFTPTGNPASNLDLNKGEAFAGIGDKANVLRVNMVTYFVTPEGVLTRRVYGNTNLAMPSVADPPKQRDEPLIYGVERFQIQYITDVGAILNNVDINTAKLVRQIAFTIDVRGTELTANGQQHQISMSSTFSTRNVGY